MQHIEAETDIGDSISLKKHKAEEKVKLDLEQRLAEARATHVHNHSTEVAKEIDAKVTMHDGAALIDAEGDILSYSIIIP